MVDGAVLKKREGFSVEIIGPEAHQDASRAAQQTHRVAQEGVVRVDEEPVLLAVDLVFRYDTRWSEIVNRRKRKNKNASR